MSKFAGSAIAQGPYVGRIDRWSKWRPTSAEPLWLLLSGATDPPKDIGISKRRTRDAPGDKSGAFLAGVTRDLVNMEDVVGAKLFNTVKDLYFTKSAALGHIRRHFDACKSKGAHPMLYYTGHGESGTGNWCFADGTISIQEIFDMVPGGCCYPMIFSDACYSGHWANFCISKGITGFHCLAACPEYSTATDTPGEGGDLTLFMTGKKLRPSTEPMYSGGNLDDFPADGEFNTISYIGFIRGLITNSQKILISQSMHNGYFSGCFAASKLYSPRPAFTVWMETNYETLINLWKNSTSQNIYSLACDEKFGFGVFLMEGFGTCQLIVTDIANIKKKGDDGYSITACAARGSTFYIVLTQDTKEYKGKSQTWFTRHTWKEVESEIQKEYKNGKAVTGICYSTGLQKYFVVMTEMAAVQCHCWHYIFFQKNGCIAQNNWVYEKFKEGFYTTIVFNDPTNSHILTVMTKDKSRWDYQNRFRFKMKQKGSEQCLLMRMLDYLFHYFS